MSETELDALILSKAGVLWQKQAMLAGRVMLDERFSTQEMEPTAERIFLRIAALVAAGCLRMRGDIAQPRASEVRVA